MDYSNHVMATETIAIALHLSHNDLIAIANALRARVIVTRPIAKRWQEPRSEWTGCSKVREALFGRVIISMVSVDGDGFT